MLVTALWPRCMVVQRRCCKAATAMISADIMHCRGPHEAVEATAEPTGGRTSKLTRNEGLVGKSPPRDADVLATQHPGAQEEYSRQAQTCLRDQTVLPKLFSIESLFAFERLTPDDLRAESRKAPGGDPDPEERRTADCRSCFGTTCLS